MHSTVIPKDPIGADVLNRTCQAAVFETAGEPLKLRTFDLPSLESGEMLVRVNMATICGSDVHTYLGRRTTPVPTILGHEILGEVAEVGPGDPPQDVVGNAVRIGQRITWSIASSCSACFFCERDLPQKCERLFKYGHQAIQSGRELSGGLAEFCHVQPGTAIVSLPDSLPNEVACPANCATATVAAALRRAGGCEGEVVLIQGAGMLGLTACAMAKESGAQRVLISDVDAKRLKHAEKFGATATIDVRADRNALAKVVAEHTAGRGVDVALELSGAVDAVASSIAGLRVGGRCILVGSTIPSPTLSLDPEQVVRRLLTIHGLHNYTPSDLRQAVAFLDAAHTRLPFSSLVHESFPLAEADAAMQFAIANQPPRVAVVPGSETAL